MGTSLGPLEWSGDRWTVGDYSRPYGDWLVFRADGLYQRTRTEELLIPWSRIMLGPRFTLGEKHPKSGNYGPMAMLGGLPGPWKGIGRGYLHMTLRHPYEDRVVAFNRHPRWYDMTELALFGALLAHTGHAKKVHKFGDADWVGHAIGQLLRQRPRKLREIERVMDEILQA
ncbi:hypothetical protein [Streptomyces sp. NPDC007100]